MYTWLSVKYCFRQGVYTWLSVDYCFRNGCARGTLFTTVSDLGYTLSFLLVAVLDRDLKDGLEFLLSPDVIPSG